MPAPKHEFLALTSIRFFLALWVVLYHLSWPGGPTEGWASELPQPLFSVLRGAALSLSLFFISSGFILAYHYPLDKPWSKLQLARFGVARFSRVYPVYALGLLLMLPFQVAHLLSQFTVETAGKELFSFVMVVSLLQSWVPQTALAWNGPGWSLSTETFFYAMFPFLGVWLWRVANMRAMLLAGLVLWCVALAAPLASIATGTPGFGNVPATSYVTGTETFVPVFAASGSIRHTTVPVDILWANIFRFNPLLRISEFLMGILASRVYKRLSVTHPQLAGNGAWLYGPGLVGMAVALLSSQLIPYPVMYTGLMLPLAVLVVIGFAFGGGWVVRLLSLRPLVFLGSASYGIYLLHTPIYGWMSAIARRLFGIGLLGPVWSVFYVVVVVLISCLVFERFENPANQFLRKRLGAWVDRRWGKAAANDTGSKRAATTSKPADLADAGYAGILTGQAAPQRSER